MDQKYLIKGWGCISVAECLTSMCETEFNSLYHKQTKKKTLPFKTDKINLMMEYYIPIKNDDVK